MKWLVVLFLSLVSCVSVPKYDADVVFNEYCRNGKQIKKFDPVIEIVFGKFFDYPAPVAAMMTKRYADQLQEKFFKAGAFAHFYDGIPSVYLSTNDEKLIQSLKNVNPREDSWDFMLFRLEDGRFILTEKDRWTEGKVCYRRSGNSCIDAVSFSDINWKYKEEFGVPFKTPELTMFEAYGQDIQEYLLGNLVEMKVTSTANGIRIQQSYDMNDFCRDAVPSKYLEVR